MRGSGGINKERIMKSFKSIFSSVLLSEADDSLERALSGDLDNVETNDKDASELEKSLEDEQDSTEDTDEAGEVLRGKIEKKIKEGNDKIAKWAEALEDFAAFINDPKEPESIRHIIDNADSSSALAAVRAEAGSQMTKVATDCVVLAQTLKSLIGSVTVKDVIGNE